MYSGGGLTSCSNSSNSDNGKLENTGDGEPTGGGEEVDREITEQYENEYMELLLTFYDDGTFEFKNDKGYVSKGTYTKSGGKITGTLTSGAYKDWFFEVDTSTGTVNMNGNTIPGFEKVTTPSDPNDKDNPSNPNPNEPEIVVPEYLVLKDTVIISFIESKLPDDGAVEIPEGVTGISPNSQVFYFRKKIKSVTIPSTMTTICFNAFELCENLETVKISDGVKEIGKEAFAKCTNLKSVSIPSSVTAIGERAFVVCTNLTEINIPDGVTEIGEDAFFRCGFTEVTIPASVTKIGKSAFEDCESLKSVKICDGVKEIGESAFEGCDSLKSVNIPSSVTTIGYGAFRGCFNLTEINIPDGVTEIGEYAFFNCRLTGDVVIPASVTKIGKSAFAHNYGLLSVTFDDTEGWYDNNEEEIDVSDSTKNMSELTNQNSGKWCNLGIYKQTN